MSLKNFQPTDISGYFLINNFFFLASENGNGSIAINSKETHIHIKSLQIYGGDVGESTKNEGINDKKEFKTKIMTDSETDLKKN